MINQLHKWFEHIQIIRPELNNIAICPFAKKAVVLKQYKIAECTFDSIVEHVNNCNVEEYRVYIYYLPTYEQYTVEDLENKSRELNVEYKKDDKVILDNDPRSPLIIQGLTTTFPECYLWIVQSLSDLTDKSNSLKNTSYYTYWTKKQLDEVVTWRNTDNISKR